ncbi:Myb-like DNA-binding domain protein [Serendipita sp. 399]|nr:Myb-like DNA-binding domain protein [Serendipita sp. 399]
MDEDEGTTNHHDVATRVEDALKANERRKLALMEYIHNLEAQIASVDALIGSAEAHLDVPDDMESDEELPYVVSIPNAIPAVPPISSSQLEDLSSPFYHASQRHRLYNELTSSRTWTETENATLKDAVQREGMRYHALQLQSQGYPNALSLLEINGRIAVDCMKAYRATSGRAIPTAWTPELDDALLKAVEKYGASNMTTVAMSMPISIGRQQCIGRYEILIQKRVSGKWSEEEDVRLKALLVEIPPETEGRWKRIAERMKTRKPATDDSDGKVLLMTDTSRFRDVLDESYRRDDWSESEDQIIQDTLVAASASNRKPDIKGLAQQLNRPIEKLRKRVIAFSSGSIPRKTFNQKGKGVEQTQSAKARRSQKTDASHTPEASDAPGREESPVDLSREREPGDQGKGYEQDQDQEMNHQGAINKPQERLYDSGDDEGSDINDSDSEYQEELSVREVRRRRATRQREEQAANRRGLGGR